MAHKKAAKKPVPHTLAFVDELARRILAIEEDFKRRPRVTPEDTGCHKWHAAGASEMAGEILGLLAFWPTQLEALQEEDFDEDERLKGLCRYAQGLDAERLEILIAIRVIQEERATRKGGSGATVKRQQTRTPRHKR